MKMVVDDREATNINGEIVYEILKPVLNSLLAM